MNKKIVIFFLLFSFALPAQAFKPNDPYLDNQWYLKTIHAYEAWDTAQGSHDVIVAVIDTGGDFYHPAFFGNLFENFF